jgi:hypothetical protein
MSSETKVYFPFYQIKSAGHVIDHTNKQDEAEKVFSSAVKPAEMWRIFNNGSAQLLRRVS